MPYKVRLGPHASAYVREKMPEVHPEAEEFFKYLVGSVEEGIIDLQLKSEYARSLLGRIEKQSYDDLKITPEQKTGVIADLRKTVAIVPDAWVCWIECRLSAAPTLFFSLYFEVRPPALDETIPEVWIFKLSVDVH